MSTTTATGRKVKTGATLANTVVYLLMIIGGVIMAVPFLWMLSTSLKPDGEVFSYPPQWIPSTFAWDTARPVGSWIAPESSALPPCPKQAQAPASRAPQIRTCPVYRTLSCTLRWPSVRDSTSDGGCHNHGRSS